MTGQEIHEQLVEISLVKEMINDKVSQIDHPNGSTTLTYNEANKLKYYMDCYYYIISHEEYTREK